MEPNHPLPVRIDPSGNVPIRMDRKDNLVAEPLRDLKGILHHIVDTVGRPGLHEDIDNLDGNIDATPPPPEEGEAEKIAAEIAALQKRASEINGDVKAEVQDVEKEVA
jgi:hypothetical protein